MALGTLDDGDRMAPVSETFSRSEPVSPLPSAVAEPATGGTLIQPLRTFGQ